MPTVLGYWNIRALGQPIRFLLAYTEQDFKDVTYEIGPDLNKEEWYKVRDSVDLPFPNLPYLIDGDIKLTQTNAILRHIGRKHNLLGNTEEEQRAVDFLLAQVADFHLGLIMTLKDKDEEKTNQYIKNLPELLQRYETFIVGRKWSASDAITVADFRLYEVLDSHQILVKEIFNKFPNLKAFLNRFEELPQIKAYMESDKFKRFPVFPFWSGRD